MDSYQSAKEEIKAAADIVELVGQYVQLKKAGLNFSGLCPFHSEKAPSFAVSPSKQIFHCFGCKKGGDIFSFWMDYHKVSFPQAMRDLAEKYQVTLPEKKMSPSRKREMDLKEELYKINKVAAEYFHHVLLNSKEGKPGREYFESRSINQEVIGEYGLGYAPDEWSGLASYLSSKNVDMDKAFEAGLIIPKKNQGYYDRFRGRVIFPIINLSKQVAGFGGRVLDDTLPKYLNTPETPVFRKSELLYGLPTAFKTVREKRKAVIVEGYTDVLALRRHGFKEAVATLGTALTKYHIRRLKGYTSEAVVVFDADNAGMGAAIKSLPLFLNEGLSSRIMVLPEGHDPDSYVRQYELDNFIELLEDARPLFDFYLDLKLSQLSEGVEGQLSILREIIPFLLELNDESQRFLYSKAVSQKAGIAESIILSELKKGKRGQARKVNENNLKKSLSSMVAKKQHDNLLLNLAIHSPKAMDRLMKTDYKVLLSDSIIIEIFNQMREIYEKDRSLMPPEILEKIKKGSAQDRFREEMLAPPICQGEAVDQAIIDFERRIHQIKLDQSTIKGIEKRDLMELNHILKEKRKEELKINGTGIFQEGK